MPEQASKLTPGTPWIFSPHTKGSELSFKILSNRLTESRGVDKHTSTLTTGSFSFQDRVDSERIVDNFFIFFISGQG